MEWKAKFWDAHGERIFFLFIAFALALFFLYSGVEELEKGAPALMFTIVGLCINKARGAKPEEPKNN